METHYPWWLVDIETNCYLHRADRIEIVEVEGAVEYKSLPSGLHNVSEDLVYA